MKAAALNTRGVEEATGGVNTCALNTSFRGREDVMSSTPRLCGTNGGPTL